MEIKSSTYIAERVFNELRQYNDQFEPKVNYQPFGFSAEENGEFVGGIEGYIAWDAIEIGNMVVLKKRQGIGRKLLEKVESFAKENGVKTITLWTLDFQAPEFYKKCGYELSVTIPNYAGKYSQHHFMKRI